MTVAELIAWCNLQVDNTVDDADWIGYFNEARIDLLDILRLEETSTTDLVADQNEYALPSDYYSMGRVRVKVDGEYETYERLRIDDSNLDGYKIWADEIILSPDITSAVVAGLKLYYYKKPIELTATTDTIDIADPYLYGLYACAKVELGDKALSVSNRYYSEYLERRNNRKREADTLRPVIAREVW